MRKISGCMYIFIFFVLVSSLAFFPLNRGDDIRSNGDSIEDSSILTPIPQRVDSDTSQQILTRNENLSESLIKDQSFLNRGNPYVLEDEDKAV